MMHSLNNCDFFLVQDCNFDHFDIEIDDMYFSGNFKHLTSH